MALIALIRRPATFTALCGIGTTTPTDVLMTLSSPVEKPMPASSRTSSV